ncbi:hypothetical protein KI688_003086 [Linnemannia hyalina]|uniref:NACHT domain-containing protein n=1 Tax=Linnemannia hyalina TaxID=64524 RepID=A0A9P8BRB1_9FUNG|nr:hypothetical protein KI688_003086 [Linnemannia hyalina]
MSRKRNSYSPERDYTKRLCLGTSSLRLEDPMESPIERELQRLKIRCLQKEEQPPGNYIAPLGKDTMDASDSSASPLLPTVMDFLKGKRKVLLVMGDGGSGKTYLLRQLERELWGKYAGSDTDAIPILFDLSRVDTPKFELLTKVFKNEGINKEHVRTLKLNNRPLVLLCDGYDEAQVGGNIYNGNKFNSHGYGCVKLIIACRSQKLGSDFESQFQPEVEDRYNPKKLDLFQKVAMAPFTRSMIEEYVGKYIESPSQLEVHQDASQSSQSPPTWSVKQYMMALADIPNLMELVGNPFILSVVLRLLPTLTSPTRDDTGSHVSFDALYKLVFENWMEVNKRRLYSYSRENMNGNEEAFSELIEHDFAAECLKHMKDLAAEIFKNQRKDALSVRHTFKDPAKWKNRFFGSDARTRLLRESLPMTRSGKTYSFLFPSLLDYLYSLVVFDPKGPDEGNMDTDGSGTDGLDSEDSARSAEPLYSKSGSGQSSERGRALQEQQVVERGQALKKGHALGFTNISERPMAVQFLADRVQIHQVLKEQLIETVHESANGDGNDKWLAANAMAILVKSGMRFNGANLRSIKIKGANLTGGEFDFADLRDADLRDVTFDKCWLREARLDRALLEGSKFGESPYTLFEDVPTASAYSPDGTLHAVTFDHRFIIFYYTSNWTHAFRSRDFSDAITSVAFSPDSKTLAFGDEFGVLRLWRYTATTIITPLPSAHAAISDIAFSPDGSRIATAGQDGAIGIWDAAMTDAGSGVRTIYLGADGGRPSCVAFSPDGKRLVSGGSDGIIQLWNLDTGSLVSTLKTHNAAISRVLFSSDGLQIVSSSSDNTVRVGSPSTTTKQIVFRGHTAAVTGFVYLSDGQLASCSQDSTIRLWDTRSGGSGPVFRGHTDHIVSIAYSRETAQLVSCGRERTRRIWDCGAAVKGSILFGRTNTKSSGMYPYSVINDTTFRPTIPSSRRFFSSELFDTKVTDIATSGDGLLAASVHTVSGTPTINIWLSASKAIIQALTGHSKDISCVIFSPDNQHIASGSADKTIRIWNAQSGVTITTLKGHDGKVTSIAYSPTGHYIVSGSKDSTVRLWEASTGDIVYSFDAEGCEVQCVAFSPSGSWIASGGEDGAVSLWDPVNLISGLVFDGGHDRTVNSIAFSPDGIHIASGGDDNTVRIWNINTGTKVRVLEGHMDPVRCLAFSSSGMRIFSGGDDRTVRIWDVDIEANAFSQALIGHSKDISCVVFSPDNKHVASGSPENTIRIGNVQSGVTIKTLKGHEGRVTSIAYSPTGHHIVSGSMDGTVRLWEASTGDIVYSFDAEGCEAQCVAISSKGRWVAAGGEDKVVRLWDINSGDDGPVLSGSHRGTVSSVAFSPDGIHIASGGDDNTVRIWNIDTETELHVLEGHMDPIRCLAFSSSGMRIFSGGADLTMRIWDVATGTLACSPSEARILSDDADRTVGLRDVDAEALVGSLAHTNSVDGLSISSDGAQLWTVSDGGVHAWTIDVFGRKPAAAASSTEFSRDCRQVAWSLGENKVQLFSVETGEPGLVLHGHSDAIECVSYSPKHNIIATASSDKTVRIWNSVQGGCLKVLRDQDVIFTSIVFSPDGRQITMSCETRWRLLNLEPEFLLKAGEQGDVLQEDIVGSIGHTVDVTSAPVYSPDGKEISVGAVDFSVRRYPTRSGVNSPAPLVGHVGIVTCIAYSPQLDKIATGSGDNTARIWDRYTGQQLFFQSEHSGGITSIAFAPFDDKVATGDNQFIVRIWDWANSGSVRSLRGHDGPVLCVAYSPDGRFLASGSADRTMRLWDAVSGACLATVKDFAAGVESIRWKETQEGYRLATGSVENPLGIWELVEDKDRNGTIRQHVRRCWGAGVHALAVSGARIGRDQGLNEADVTLLKQRNAVFTPPVLV